MLVTLTNAPRDYEWGSRTLIAGLQGRGISDVPEAEIWYGDHPSDPSEVGDGTGRTLDAWLRDENVTPGVGGRLPYLLKVLAAGRSLSIQAHPTKDQAVEGYAREASLPAGAARNYADDNHKPEMIVALSDTFTAICGLREIGATQRLLANIGPAAHPLAERIRDEHSLGEAVRWLLSGDAQGVVDAIIAALGDARATEFSAELSNARANAAEFPGDAGVVVGLLMNLVQLRRGEALFLRAGQLHAYQSGLGVEIMAASDNVLRGGLTPKHIDVDELMNVLDRSAGPIPVILPTVFNGDSHGLDQFPAPVGDFQLLRGSVSAGSTARLQPNGPMIVLSTGGAVQVNAGGTVVHLRPGEAAFATPDEQLVEMGGDGEFFVAQPGHEPRDDTPNATKPSMRG
ncbi:mannose-6-phosphate isomerase, class I [Microbacterium amylolyticum]|uniref:mannose-6-phosphate isomerase n=1 Tax=Microbacterium amylolyticum TaxID=936337 RepID=A0ABS4ZKV7_9MICO|nr:mannose-6-phosphate isomerase, class I [Microbacterium amylolyticum]MBP2437580.1 mannose-6-phosphate isomerase [Microbacterium amylolyticum]